MSKRHLIDLPGENHFVTFSTYQRRRFLAAEKAKSLVLAALQKSLHKHHAHCHGFVVMPNHVHAILSVDPLSNISTFLLAWKKTSSHQIKQFYREEMASYYDLCPPGCPIWQAKFYDFNLSQTTKFNEKLDYMHHNPVAAGLAQRADEWKWSSARFYACGEDTGVTITLLP